MARTGRETNENAGGREMWTKAFTQDERMQRYLLLAARAERDGAFDIARIYRRMARDLGPAPAARHTT
jgi:rubrerythrin